MQKNISRREEIRKKNLLEIKLKIQNKRKNSNFQTGVFGIQFIKIEHKPFSKKPLQSPQ